MVSVLEKQPWEEIWFSMYMSFSLLGDATISSIVSIEALPSRPTGLEDLTVGSESISGGAKVNFQVTGGTDGEQYPIRVRIEDSIGNKLEGDGILKLIDRS